jgi:hypothetical protein
MARKGTAKAKGILAGIMAEFGVSLDDLRSHGSRTENLCRAKEAYVVRCAAAGLQTVVMAEVAGLDRATIAYRSDPELRERRRQYDLQHPRRNRPRRAKSKVISAAATAGW